MPYKRFIPICAALLLAACVRAAPTPAIVPTHAPPTPTAVLTPTSIPTATPIPPLQSTLLWPAQVSALEPVPIQVELISPPGIDVPATVNASVLAPDFGIYKKFTLQPQAENVYAADKPLYLPLEPPDGTWHLAVEIQSELEVRGEQVRAFQPVPIAFRDLAEILPAGIDLRVPEDFVEVVSQGDRTSGGRVWRHGGGEVSIWWIPGPTKPLLSSNAVVMAEATYGENAPTLLSTEEATWQDRTAFLFQETWPGEDGGPGRTVVVQGPDYWLYALRVRAIGGEAIPPLMEQIWDTFAFVAE